MIPNVFKILQLLGSATRVIFIIMFLLISVNSQSSCNSKPVKAKTIYNGLASAYLAVRNGTVATIADKPHTLYTITIYMNNLDDQRDYRKSSKFFIFDPSENKFICLMKKKLRFVAKKIPKPENLCLFIEEPLEYQVKYVVEYGREQYTLKFGKNGKQIARTIPKSNRSEYFMSKLINSGCGNATSTFCNNLSKKRHYKMPQTIRKICLRN